MRGYGDLLAGGSSSDRIKRLNGDNVLGETSQVGNSVGSRLCVGDRRPHSAVVEPSFVNSTGTIHK